MGDVPGPIVLLVIIIFYFFYFYLSWRFYKWGRELLGYSKLKASLLSFVPFLNLGFFIWVAGHDVGWTKGRIIMAEIVAFGIPFLLGWPIVIGTWLYHRHKLVIHERANPTA